MNDRKYPLTDYGIAVKTQLMRMGKTQEWLICELTKNTNMFVDCSVVNKILTGRLNSKKLISEINSILKLK